MSAEPVAPIATLPAASAGEETVTDGAVLSTVNVTGAEKSGPLPATSVTATRTWAGPSGEPTELHEPL